MAKLNRKILVIDQSDLLRDYFKTKLEASGFEVILAKNGVDGLIKMRNQLPDLIIMDFYLSQLSAIEFLEEKQKLKGTSDLPIIMLSTNIERRSIVQLSRYKIYKILSKPVEVDILFKAISELFKTTFEVDSTPCIIDVHLNDDILFVEVAKGLNKEKVELMRYRIMEVKSLYNISIRKILIIITNLDPQNNLSELLEIFMGNVVKSTEALLNGIIVLTNSGVIKSYFGIHPKYKMIKITDNFVDAIDHLGKVDLFAFGEEIDDIQKDLISSAKFEKENEGALQLKFSSEKIKLTREDMNAGKKFSIAVVDDDLSILEYMETVLAQANWKINVYENGRVFIDDFENTKPDLVFLDLMMPKMSGFEVLDLLSQKNVKTPIIVLTALANKESIIKARSYGITSYLTKPIKPQVIVHKAEEILKSNF
jgi:DNA-binding response OmpR family regulator